MLLIIGPCGVFASFRINKTESPKPDLWVGALFSLRNSDNASLIRVLKGGTLWTVKQVCFGANPYLVFVWSPFI